MHLPQFTMEAKDWVLLIAGFVLGFLANLMAWPVTERVEKRRLRKRFRPIGGRYVGYLKSGDQIGKQSSTAIVRYEQENCLSIEVSEAAAPGNVWVGEIVMDGVQGGSIVWRYKTLHGTTTGHRFGFKRCIYAQIDGRSHLYLIGERPDYGAELLIQDSKPV